MPLYLGVRKDLSVRSERTLLRQQCLNDASHTHSGLPRHYQRRGKVPRQNLEGGPPLPESRHYARGLLQRGVAQLNLFDNSAPRAGSEKLMEVLDRLNAKDGKGTLYFAGQGIQQQWQMKREMLSPRYTTRYSDLLRIR